MNLNESYTTWANSPTPENYEIFGRDLLAYVKGRIRKVRSAPRDVRTEMPINVIIRVLSEISQYDPTRSPFTVWVNYKIDHVAADMTTEAFDRQEYGLFEGHEAPDDYKGIEAKILLKQLMETLSVDEQRQVHLHLEGHEATEIAKILGISDEAAWKRWERIKEKMRKSSE
jgi:DNA-directed RNA polymerase specialized sigma24 family protein